MTQSPFVGLGFCATFKNADPAAIAPLGVVRALAPQIAFGMQPSQDDALLPDWIDRCGERGLGVVPWAWCAATSTIAAAAEGQYHAERCVDLGLSGAFVANPEEAYDAHGDQSSPRYHMVTAYVQAFTTRARELGLEFEALGLTSTPTFASDMTLAITDGWVGMPQAFPLASVGATIANCVDHWNAWGWPNEQLRPLVQTYRTDGAYPAAHPFLEEAAAAGVGVVPYTVEQALDTEGAMLLNLLRPATFFDPTTGGEHMEKIGFQNGVRAAMNRLRDLDPSGTSLVKSGGKWPGIDTLPPDVNTWRAYDKLERALSILVADHDAAAGP